MREYSKLPRLLINIFCCVFAVMFSVAVVGAVISRCDCWPVAVILVALTAVGLLLLVLFYRLLTRKKEFVERYYKFIISAMLAALFCVQIIFGLMLRYQPIFDLNAVYGGALHWVQTGSFADYTDPYCHDNYFYIFPNNLGTLSLFYVLFKAATAVGITDYFAVATVANSLVIIGSVYMTTLICKRKFGAVGGVFAGAIFLISPPFWFMAAVFYTDTLSMIIPVAVYYLCICANKHDSAARRMPYYLASAVLSGVGALIKPTVLIVSIAVAVAYALQRNWRSLLAFAATSAVIISAVMCAFNGYIYSAHLDKTTADKMNMPYEYWLSLGLSGNGQYNNEYFALAVSEPDPDVRVQKLRDVISDNLSEQGVAGVTVLFCNKLGYLFGDGTLALSDHLDDYPINPNPLHDWILYSGNRYTEYSAVTTALFLAVLILMLIAVPVGKGRVNVLVPFISVFGLTLFLLFWEVNVRYITNFVPMIYVCAVCGAHKLSSLKLKQCKR